MNEAYVSDMMNHVVDRAYELLDALHEMSDERRPVCSHAGGNGGANVICNDGSVWSFYQGEWGEQSPIPGTRRAKEKTQTTEQAATGAGSDEPGAQQ